MRTWRLMGGLAGVLAVALCSLLWVAGSRDAGIVQERAMVAIALLTATALGAVLVVAARSASAPAPAGAPDTAPSPAEGADLGALAAGLAHELGQPLSAARVDIEGLHLLRQLGREPAPEHRDRVLARVGTCILSMTQTIEHLRSLATEPATATCRPVDLRTVVEAVLSERDRWLTLTDTQVNFDPPSFACPVLADPAGLRLILVNLLRNAAEAVAGQDPSRRMVRVRIGPGARVSVEDGGPGLRPEQMARIFEPFRTTKGAGRGVGLALARASALRMRADLTVESEPGLGTRFTLRLPEVAT